MKKLGIPTTLGELRKMCEKYPDETLLQFRNEPIHELFFDDEQGLLFQEESSDFKTSLKRILANNAYNLGNMQIDNDVSKLCKTIYYLEGQLGMIGRFGDEQYKEQQKESIKNVIKIANDILQK